MKFVDLGFIARRMLEVKSGNIVLSIKKEYMNIPIKVLDTNTGKVAKITFKELVQKPIRPFSKDGNYLYMLDSYNFKDIYRKILRIKDYYFYLDKNYMLMWLKGEVYYRYIKLLPYDEISGFNTYNNSKNITYYIPNYENMSSGTIPERVLFYKREYFIPELDSEDMYKVDVVSATEFKRKVKTGIYLAKVKLLGI